jgi:hypothetical protein
MNKVTIQIRDTNTGAVIAARALSADAGSLQRREAAERLANEKADPRDVYAVEFKSDSSTPKGRPGRVIDKYELTL